MRGVLGVGARRDRNEKSPDLETLYLKDYLGQSDNIIFHPFQLVVHAVLPHLYLLTDFIHDLKCATSFFKNAYSLK